MAKRTGKKGIVGKNEFGEDIFEIELDEQKEKASIEKTRDALAAAFKAGLKSKEKIEIICPECGNEVVLDEDNKCPECGCEFEENIKEFKLTKFGALITALSSIFYLMFMAFMYYTGYDSAVSSKYREIKKILLDIINDPTASKLIGAAALLLALSILVVAVRPRGMKLAISLLMLSIAGLSLRLFWFSQAQTLFCPFAWALVAMPAVQVFGGFFCFIDQFINPSGAP